MNSLSPAAAPDSPRLITPRAVRGLAFCAFAQAALVLGVALPGVPLLGLTPVEFLPGALAGLAAGLALFLAPVWAAEIAGAPREAAAAGASIPFDGRLRLARAGFLAAWQGGAAGFFLLAASRLSPVEAEGILRAGLVVTAVAAVAAGLAARWPRPYAGLAFLWAAGIPVVCYLVAEVFLTTPAGASGWSQASGPGAYGFRQTVRGLLAVSPCTASVGALEGRLITGDSFRWLETAIFCATGVGLSWALLSGNARPAKGGIQQG